MLVTETLDFKCTKRYKDIIEQLELEFKKDVTYTVKVSDLIGLKIKSSRDIEVYCDYCLEKGIRNILMKSIYHVIQGREIIPKDACKVCVVEKIKEVNLLLYGVENSFQRKDVKEKIVETNIEKYGTKSFTQTEEYKIKRIETCLERYGVEHPFQNKDIRNKVTETNIEKYGVHHYMQTEEGQEKRKQTCMERYGEDHYAKTDEFKVKFKETSLKKFGVETPAQSQEVKEKVRETNIGRYGFPCSLQNESVQEKIRNTNIERYGTPFPSQNPDIKSKTLKSLYENGNQKTSNQQRYLNNILNGEINFPHYNASLDIAFPEEKIYLEYDGGGHDLNVKLGRLAKDEQIVKERRRWYALYRDGWREIRVISKRDYLPLDEKIAELFHFAKEYLNTDHSWIHFDLDEATVKTSQFEQPYDYGKLRKINKNDIEKSA